MKITEDMRVCEVLEHNSDFCKIFEKHGLPCAGCPASISETLKEASEGHGIDLTQLLLDLNKSLEE